MKVSLAWIFDHIYEDYTKIDVQKLIDQFNKTTAEISSLAHHAFNSQLFTLVTVQNFDKDTATVFSQQLNMNISLKYRSDLDLGLNFLIYKGDKGWRWATMTDLGAEKEGLLTSLSCTKEELGGSWLNNFEHNDYILDIDNKSLTNRPDMWSHRGVAREIAAMLKLKMRPIQDFLVEQPIQACENVHTEPTQRNPFTVFCHDNIGLLRYAGLYCQHIDQKPTIIKHAVRLARIDTKPINAIVDATNYVMLDIGQPMHAFDAQKIPSKTIETRFAHDQEQITLLDGQTLNLNSQDYLITDGKQPIALAGVMGGTTTAIDATTNSIFIESACFDATVIRKTTVIHHIRTESSARYEKSLDPNLTTQAIMRLLKIFRDAELSYTCSPAIICVGQKAPEHKIIVEHTFIETRIGTSIEKDFVLHVLTALDFKVAIDSTQSSLTYIITVPTSRCTKDVRIKEDIVEEIARFFGYGSLKCDLPTRAMGPFNTHKMLRTREIKNCMSNALSMREVSNYAMFDESFIKELGFSPTHYVTIKNPVSENWTRMVTSLIPGLLKNVKINKQDAEILQFFEFGRTWRLSHDIQEQRILAGILFDHKNPVDFYAAKFSLTRLFDMLKLKVTYKQIDTPEFPWLAPYQSAYIYCNDTRIGYLGIGNASFLINAFEGYACMFELDGDFLLNFEYLQPRFVPSSKYPSVERDISILAPSHISVDAFVALIRGQSELITKVTLIDFFTKKEWLGKRSLTLRYCLQNQTKTLSSHEIDAIAVQIIKAIELEGATVR